VGTATIYRHYPTRADLILAVYRLQVEALAEAGPALLAGGRGPHQALVEWIDRFVDFVITKQGLASVLQSGEACYDPLHTYFLERLGPVCTQLLDAAAAAGEIVPGQDAFELMRGVGSLCAGAGTATYYDARRLVKLLVNGLRRP
jgi:AcrR family transcriptional regulator